MSSWLDDLISVYGEPRVKPPAGGVKLGRSIRRAWVWFPGGVNHSLHIDDCGDFWEAGVASHTGKGYVRREASGEPTDAQIRAMIRLAWELDI